MFCNKCGHEVDDEAVICPNCGCYVSKNNKKNLNNSTSTIPGWGLALFCLFLGLLGIHRFVVGKVGTGILWLLTGGCFFIGAIIDLIMICCSAFTDKDGNRIPFIKN